MQHRYLDKNGRRGRGITESEWCNRFNPVLIESAASLVEQQHYPVSGKEQIGSNRVQQQHRTSVSRKRIGDYDELSVLSSCAQRVQHSAPAYNILPFKS